MIASLLKSPAWSCPIPPVIFIDGQNSGQSRSALLTAWGMPLAAGWRGRRLSLLVGFLAMVRGHPPPTLPGDARQMNSPPARAVPA